MALVTASPWRSLRGCIRSDGCAFINRTDIHRPQPYKYLSYHFGNLSKDMIDMFTAACDLAGVHDYLVPARRGTLGGSHKSPRERRSDGRARRAQVVNETLNLWHLRLW